MFYCDIRKKKYLKNFKTLISRKITHNTFTAHSPYSVPNAKCQKISLFVYSYQNKCSVLHAVKILKIMEGCF